MLIRIEKGSSVPISKQLAEQIAALCAAGRLQPGDRVPSVRELARELAVNQNTVLRVYERLTGEGLLERRHGQGTFVAKTAGRKAAAAHKDRLVEELRQLARQAQGLGLSADELHGLLAQAWEQLGAESTQAEEANQS